MGIPGSVAGWESPYPSGHTSERVQSPALLGEVSLCKQLYLYHSLSELNMLTGEIASWRRMEDLKTTVFSLLSSGRYLEITFLVSK